MQDIPKLYTALAEWMACITYIIVLRKRRGAAGIAVISVVSLFFLCMIQYEIGIRPVRYWIPGMLLAMLVMYAMLMQCLDISWMDAGFIWATAFVLAEFAAALEWQLYSFFWKTGEADSLQSVLFLFFIYICVFSVYILLDRRVAGRARWLRISQKDMAEAVFISVVSFLVSNISYVYKNTPFSGSMLPEIFYIRTLVDFAGVIMIMILKKHVQEQFLQKELNNMDSLLRLKYEQFKQSKRNIEMINRKYHDLKHQIQLIRMEEDPEKKRVILDTMEDEIQMYGTENKTGNDVFDIILTDKSMYCVQHDIQFICAADGKLLDFMNAMDLSSLFGNAIDNAIESSLKIKDKDKRYIKVTVFTQNYFLMARFENYYEDEIKIEEGVLVTSKKDYENHGYGIQSIQYIAEKYSGTVSIHMENNWFDLKVLIPL